MKKLLAIIMTLVLLFSFAACSETGTATQGSGTAQGTSTNNTKLGDYNVDIKSCRIAEDYEGEPIVIVTYGFTNNGNDSASFSVAITDEAYQNGIGLNPCYFAADSANYNSDNQNKEIKKGATLDVEIAYELNDATTDVEVEVSELISFSDKKITKTFKIAQ